MTQIYAAPWPSWAIDISQEEFEKLPREEQEKIERTERQLKALSDAVWKDGGND